MELVREAFELAISVKRNETVIKHLGNGTYWSKGLTLENRNCPAVSCWPGGAIIVLNPMKKDFFFPLAIQNASLEIISLHLTTLNLQMDSTKCCVFLGMFCNCGTGRQKLQHLKGKRITHNCFCYCSVFNTAIIPR